MCACMYLFTYVMAYVYTYMHTWGCFKHDQIVFTCICKSPIYSCIFLPLQTFSLIISTLTFTLMVLRFSLTVSLPSWRQLITKEKENRIFNFPSVSYRFLCSVALTVISHALCFMYFSFLLPASLTRL